MELFRAICQYGGVKKKREKSSLSTAVAKEVPPLKTRTHPRSYSYPSRKLHIASKNQNFIHSKKLAPQEENTYPDSRMVNIAYQDIFPIFFKFLSTSYFVNLQMTCQLLSAYLQL